MRPEVQAQYRADFRVKFGTLRRNWPNFHIPDPPESTSLEQIHAQYDIYIRHIHVSNNIDMYKLCLVVVWLAIEGFCFKIGLDISGYTVSQMNAMNKYEQLLIELGETNYKTASEGTGTQSQWPVEIRIVYASLVSAVGFIIIKMLASWVNMSPETLAPIINGIQAFFTGTTPQGNQQLFGSTQPGNSSQVSGAQPIPQSGGIFGGLNIPAMIASIGSSLFRGGTPNVTPPVNNPVPQTSNTPRFRPAYSD